MSCAARPEAGRVAPMRIRAGITLLAVALALAACGGGSKTTTTTDQTAVFKTSFKAVTGQLKQTSHGIGVAIQTAPSKTNAQLAATFGGLATEWGARSSELSGLHPPASVTPEFNRLTTSAKQVLGDLTAVAGAAGRNDVQAARGATTSLVQHILAAKASAQKVDAQLGIK